MIDSLHNKVDKMESRVFDVEAENDELKTEIKKDPGKQQRSQEQNRPVRQRKQAVEA